MKQGPTSAIKDSKLIEILKLLDKQEIERFSLFMSSTYLVPQKKVAELADIILREYPDFNNDRLLAENIYQQLYPGQKFQFRTLKSYMSLLVSYLYKFFVAEKTFSDNIEQNLSLIEELRKRELGQEFLRIGSALRPKLEKEKKDRHFYYKLFRFENEMDTYHIANKEFLNSSDSLQQKANSLDIFFLYSKLSLICEMINRQNIFSYDYDISMLDFVLDYAERNFERLESYPAVGAYYRILLTLTYPSREENYFKLIDLLDKTSNEFSKEELKDMYAYAMNYCIKQLNSGRIDYEGHLFKLYGKLIETGLIYDNNHISQWDYKNIIATSLRVSEFEWTENFIHSNKDRINPGFREVAYAFNLANLYCEKKEFANALKTLHKFDDALKKISDPDFDDTFYNLDSRSIFIKIYYESNEDDLLKATIDAFKSYLLRNKKISERRRKIYLNLLKYTKKLSDQRYRLRYGTDARVKANVRKLKGAISEEKNLVNLSWLQARVEELEKEVG